MAPASPDEKLQLAKMVEGTDLPTSDIVQLLASHDTLAKKLTCYHITDKCSTNSDLALLTANLLLRDASDANPSVRSASISALAALPGLEESSVRVVASALSDQSAMVRRAGAVACVRLYSHASQSVLDCGLVDSLYEGLRDSDPIVITNCILALDHILQEEGGVVVNKNIVHYLLGRIMQFSECNAVYVLSLLLRYTPKSEEELILLLNGLDELLLSKASAVLVATVKLFLHWTLDHTHLKKDMLEMIQPSVCKILSRNVPETSYLMLEFLSTLGDIQQIFGSHYKYFLVRAKDPGYLKTRKLEVLPLVSTECNVCCLIEEVKPYCSDYQSFRSAVTCLGALAQVSPAACELCVSILITLLDAPTERVVIAALECLLKVFNSLPMKNRSVCLSKELTLSSQLSVGDADTFEHDDVPLSSTPTDTTKSETSKPLPELPQDLTKAVTRALSRGTVQEMAPSLVLRVLGTLASYLDSAPDILQRMSSLSSSSKAIHADLVMAAARIFLSRPAQSQLLLAAILSKALKTPGEPASRAALVYSALLEGPTDAALLLGADIHRVALNSHDCEGQPVNP